MVVAIAEVTEVCEEPQPGTSGAPARARRCMRTWICHRGVKPLSIRWVDKDDYHTAKARLTARGCEHELTGQENFDSVT